MNSINKNPESRLNMVAYVFYFNDGCEENSLIGVLPERRENKRRVTRKSIMKWGRLAAGSNVNPNSIYYRIASHWFDKYNERLMAGLQRALPFLFVSFGNRQLPGQVLSRIRRACRVYHMTSWLKSNHRNSAVRLSMVKQYQETEERGEDMDRAKEILKKRKSNRERLEKEAPDLYHGFNELMKHYYKHGALDRRQKELMAVAAAVATRCIPWLVNHANNAILAGAKRDEVFEAAAIGIEFGGGPSFVIVRDNLLDFLDDIEKK